MRFVAWIPARASPKNRCHIGGMSLTDHVLTAAHSTSMISRAVVWGDESRPHHLRGPDIPISEVLSDYAMRHRPNDPAGLVLLQATSPFVSRADIESACGAICAGYRSAQTVTRVSHNAHRYNQRKLTEGETIDFIYPEERAEAYNKQRKPVVYQFGNVVAMTWDAAEAGDIWGHPCKGIEIPRLRAIDIDTPVDLMIARAVWPLVEGQLERWL